MKNTTTIELTKREAHFVSELLERLASEIDETIIDMASDTVGDDDDGEKMDEYLDWARETISKLP